LINLYGMLYKEINRVQLRQDRPLKAKCFWKPDTDYTINNAGYVIHGAIHKGAAGCRVRKRIHIRAQAWPSSAMKWWACYR